MALWGPYSRLGTDEKNDKPLPSLPSPTLTNPDLVLPDEPFAHSLPPAAHPKRAPSISYLRDKTGEHLTNRQSLDLEQGQLDGYHGPTHVRPSDRRGLTSRKMILVRSEAGGGNTPDERSRTPTNLQQSEAFASSPLLNDQLTVVPRAPQRRASGSSLDSDEMAKMPEFLNKYRNADTTDDEVTDTEGARETRAYDEKRRVQAEEEQVSALLSQRAEEILANAKKRLNLMEGNLRGARDLVAPLTAANLKRATSFSSSFGSPSMQYTHRRLDSMQYDSDPYNPTKRILQSQASSPAMRSDFYTHARGVSETELVERPYTAFSSRSPYMARSPRFPVKPSEPSSVPLRAAKSFDTFGVHKIDTNHIASTAKDSPSSNLAPVSEVNDERHVKTTAREHLGAPEAVNSIGLGVSHATYSTSGSSVTTSEDLRDQMEGLKGRISALRERAKEDSLRRASHQNLRNSSPFSNASHPAPEFWYTQPSNYGIATVDTSVRNGGGDSPTMSQHSPPWRASGLTTTRNAFAEKAAREQQLAVQSSASGGSSPDLRYTAGEKRSSGGTAIMTSMKKRISPPTHQRTQSRDMPGAFESGQFDSSEGEYETDPPSDESYMPNSEPSTPEPNGLSDESTEDESEEEYDFDPDNGYDEVPPVENSDFVAHEDREDAFDYEHFFLHSAMGSYESGRDNSSDSDLSSVSSTDTARAPQHNHEAFSDYDDEDEVDDEDEEGIDEVAEIGDDDDVVRAPGTPEALRRIESRLQQAHGRSLSSESLDTINTFATATEGRETPHMISRSASRTDWGPTTPTERDRPSTAVRTESAMAKPAALTALETDNASDRADSGVGGLRSVAGTVSTPSSPARTVVQQHHRNNSLQHDPLTFAFRSLLEPNGNSLAAQDHAAVLSVLESLRSVCSRLQCQTGADQDSEAGAEKSIDAVLGGGSSSSSTETSESEALRKKLDEARRILVGIDSKAA